MVPPTPDKKAPGAMSRMRAPAACGSCPCPTASGGASLAPGLGDADLIKLAWEFSTAQVDSYKRS
jgi:hypothetical protein